ncbi:MAG: hypothetical protein ACLP62_11565 [Acidimicrobiales bacterium]
MLERAVRRRGSGASEPAPPIALRAGAPGGLGTVWRNDPGQGRVAVHPANADFTSARLPPIGQDFLTAVHPANADFTSARLPPIGQDLLTATYAALAD